VELETTKEEHHPPSSNDISKVVLGIPNAEESATDCEDVVYVTLSSTTQASITLSSSYLKVET
jgi:hypothetical protein